MSGYDDTKLNGYSVVCRGCLADSGEMKDMHEWSLAEDFTMFTNIFLNVMDGTSELLCSSCEESLINCKRFRIQCQRSDLLLKDVVKTDQLQIQSKATHGFEGNPKEISLSSILGDDKLQIVIETSNMESKISLPCPHCPYTTHKQALLTLHLTKTHNIPSSFSIELKYHCPHEKCTFNIHGKGKHFTGRKYLNQHLNKVHNSKNISCGVCLQHFVSDSDFKRHLKDCNVKFTCGVCGTEYRSHERLLVHLMRKHPDVHKQYLEQRKQEKVMKRASESATKESKKVKIDSHFDATHGVINYAEASSFKIQRHSDTPTLDAFKNHSTIDIQTDISQTTKAKDDWTNLYDSPKRSFATQTFIENIRNDVSLPAWNDPKFNDKDEMDRNVSTIETQTVFEDLLSLKSQNSEDESIFFSETVSLSDIQTQTFPIEFGLSRKETITSETQTKDQPPDLSIKETQTCFCLCESPKVNFKLFESVSSSPSSLNFTSTETQTGDLKSNVKSDVMLSFSSTETQTCFDELGSSNDL